MSARVAQNCEVKVDGEWRTISIEEAQGTYRNAAKRCPACHGLMNTVGAYSLGRSLKLAHRRLHDGCPLTPQRLLRHTFASPGRLVVARGSRPHRHASRGALSSRGQGLTGGEKWTVT